MNYRSNFISWPVKRFFILGLLCYLHNGSLYADQVKVGWLEEVFLNGTNFPVLAKIDTGADNSSLNTTKVKIYTKDKKRWVRFTLVNRLGDDLVIEKPIVKSVRVKTKDGKYQRRNVIELDICLNTTRKRVLVNLVDRSHFKYQMLIGRSFLKPNFIVDPGAEFLHKANCK